MLYFFSLHHNWTHADFDLIINYHKNFKRFILCIVFVLHFNEYGSALINLYYVIEYVIELCLCMSQTHKPSIEITIVKKFAFSCLTHSTRCSHSIY